jgi:hypothetical protein
MTTRREDLWWRNKEYQFIFIIFFGSENTENVVILYYENLLHSISTLRSIVLVNESASDE